jgi:large subunit ribosomal protein L25
MEVPVKIIGNSKGVMAGGDLRLNNRKLKVKALPQNLPDFVEADITPLITWVTNYTLQFLL